MAYDRDQLTNPERRLPDIRLPRGSDGENRALRPAPRSSRVIFLAHGHGCAQCAAYARSLAVAEADLSEWDARLLVISRDPMEAGPEVETLLDTDGRVERALSLRPPAVLVVDEWGQVHHTSASDDSHSLPGAAELVSWARYLAIQCPECQGEAL